MTGSPEELRSFPMEKIVDDLIEGAKLAASLTESMDSNVLGNQSSTDCKDDEGFMASHGEVPEKPTTDVQGSESEWRVALVNSPNLAQFGAILAWGISRGFSYIGMEDFTKHAKPIATSVASKMSSGLFPLPVDFSKASACQWPQGDFSLEFCTDSWLNLVAVALNRLNGSPGPYPRHRAGMCVKKCLSSLRSRVARFLQQPLDPPIDHVQIWKDVCSKKISYEGEEVGFAQPLSVEQVLNSLPPLGHGGSIDVIPLLQGRTRFLMENPSQVLLQPSSLKGTKNHAKVHICPGEETSLFRLLFERGVIDFVKEEDVHRDSNGPYLSGLFGVPKPGKFTSQGKPILRLIMNLIPINRALDVIKGDISELPSASSWQQLVLVEGDTISISQADMASAFYLFRIPPAWQKFLCFNFKLTRKQAGLTGPGFVYPACRVLPMGWSSSVGVMQMASRELIRQAQLTSSDELRRGSLVPPWFVEVVPFLGGSRSWWQVYLDNFMAAEVARQGNGQGADRTLHGQATASWDASGVLCSSDKHVYQAPVATELGVEVNGPLGLMGASATRIFKAVLASLHLIGGRPLSSRMVQVVLGRWIFILQYRRPSMAVLSRAWDYINQPQRNTRCWQTLCQEITLLIGLSPLLQFDLRMEFNTVVTCSDASKSGGAVAVAPSLTVAGEELTSRLNRPGCDPLEIKVLVISVFNGIGGCFRAYDLAGLRAVALISIEIDASARRVVRCLWPHVMEVTDVKLVDRAMVQNWANLFFRLEQVHIWGGFPCVHLSSARSDRLNLEGEGSNLFFNLVEVIEISEQVFLPEVSVEFVIENVFSMDVSARSEISLRLGITPLKLDPADCSPMSRPRLAWVSFEVTATEGVELIDWGEYVEVKMTARFPGSDVWAMAGWNPTTSGITYPTFMKSIPRYRPPPSPAGLRRCSEATVLRWQSDSYRFPPYQYQYQYLLRSDSGGLRYLSVCERELLMGMGYGATQFCMSASSVKSHPTEYWDKRFSLLGDGFAMLSFAWIASQMGKRWKRPMAPQEIVDRFGLAPGAGLHGNLKAPLVRRLRYGTHVDNQVKGVELIAQISRHVSHNGSDVSISLGIPYSNKVGNHISLRAAWWSWRILFTTKWRFSTHINSLELRMIVQAARWRARFPENFNSRWLHLADSMVCNYILSKGRTSSHMLQPLVRQHAAILLALNSMELHGHVDSSENPTDKASRA